MTYLVLWQAGQLGGGVFLRPPPPTKTIKLKIYTSNIYQNPPYCTNFHLKNKNKMPGEHAPRTPEPASCFARRLKSIQAVFYTGSNYLISKIPGNTKLDLPFKNSWAPASAVASKREGSKLPALKCGVAANILRENNPVMTMIPFLNYFLLMFPHNNVPAKNEF